jgi:hypothetical protein
MGRPDSGSDQEWHRASGGPGRQVDIRKVIGNPGCAAMIAQPESVDAAYATRAGDDLVAPSSGGLASQLLDASCVTVPKCLCGSPVVHLVGWRVQPECHLPAI